MIAALGMYDRPELRPDTDGLWGLFRDRLRAIGDPNLMQIAQQWVQRVDDGLHVRRSEIEAVVGAIEEGSEGHRSPGRLTLHYAPDAPVRIEAGAAREEAIIPGEADATVFRAFKAHFAFIEEVGQRRAVATLGADEAADDAFGGLKPVTVVGQVGGHVAS